MLISTEIDVKVNTSTVNYYKGLGYDVKTNDYIIIPVLQLKLNSHALVIVQCDICGVQKHLNYSKYNKNIGRYGFYTCGKKCAITKSKKTNLEKLDVDNPMRSDIVKEKMAVNSLKNHGASYFVQTDEFKNKAKKTKIEKYGDENYSNKEQAVKTLLLNYNKTIETNQERYGCDFIGQSEQIKDKIKNSRIKSGSQVPDEKLNDWQIYKRNVKNETKKFKNQLFENWDGYDYYDREYIKDNLSLEHTNRLFPTIDHKISTHYGFLNNIPVKKIGNIENLCITKRSINSSKNNRQNFII